MATPFARPVTPSAILAARLAALAERLEGLAVEPSVRDEARELARLAGGVDGYLERCTTPESAALADLAAATRAADWAASAGPSGLEAEMLSGHVEGRLLAMLVRMTHARQVLEIGMFTGYSALAMAEALPDDGRVVACEVDADVAAFARRCFDASPAGGRIEVRVGPAQHTLAALAAAGERFDLVFVDADKAGYAGYVATLLDTGLLAPHGWLCVDNTLMQGQPWAGPRTPNGDAVAAFNEYLAAEPRVEQVLLPLRDGVTLARRVDVDVAADPVVGQRSTAAAGAADRPGADVRRPDDEE
ncbi:MAG: O-methyltransferase [Dermatophilaceae bacterium]